ncbi:MAG: hypothetical protein WB791_10355 [Waddliaceae bacterium]
MIVNLRIFLNCLFFSPFLVLVGCASSSCRIGQAMPLKSISLIDRNGMTETFSNEERLKQYEGMDFLSPQPYQKILRVHNRDEQSNIYAYVSSYHPNGQPKQFLEIVNSRAFGQYKEWHESGKIKLTGRVIGGDPDIDSSSETTWIFDDHAFVWDEEENLIADITYEKGKLQGDSFYYHPNGSLWRRIPYVDDEIDGVSETYLSNGVLLQKTSYVKGMKHGVFHRYWNADQPASEEEYSHETLTRGRYYDQSGKLISEVDQGAGYRAIFGKTAVTELHEYQHGIPEGIVKIFGTDQKLIRTFHVKNDKKHGEEIEYHSDPHLRHLAKLSINWYEGKIQGVVKTWYDNGAQESKREMCSNEKNGLSLAWYRDGNLMLLEEYDHDKLIKGEYYRRGEKHPMSLVKDGKGVATIFNPEGGFVHKVKYNEGSPAGLG